MKNEKLLRRWDLFYYKRLLKFKDDDKKDFFNKKGCGLEIEFGVKYERRCRWYIKTGLKKIKAVVGNKGKFVPDMTIGKDLNVEIVLNPLEKEELRELFFEIKEVIDFYENFVFDEHCGIHANFLADEELKEKFYDRLVNGGYDSKRFTHSKYKTDFMDIVFLEDGGVRDYKGYLDYQNRVAAKYAGVNFLKKNLVEFRTLDLKWDDIEYIINLYEEVESEHVIAVAADNLIKLPKNPFVAVL